MSSADLNKTSDYQHIFMGYCDIYQLPIQSSRNIVVETILSSPKSTFKFYTPFSRLFESLIDLISGKISLEQFMSLGDLEQKNTRLLNRSMIDKTIHSVDANTIIVLDKTLGALYPTLKQGHTIIEI